jgi:hypothetical protein
MRKREYDQPWAASVPEWHPWHLISMDNTNIFFRDAIMETVVQIREQCSC